ncbi:MAG TPA: TIGR01777 family oxidoreductase [Amycolatopsis sp.]|uniref:TIGR01777 family oxidoreductase n=1 Tax=Amycolatopsis sp. TaxID=37632 RepID=UPI002B4A0826|nr:TIGR01777 family oxidoreductase [Amycolatopsis sp.]HKS48901.1 TIGR01777 family oxidoreductase [Amycolatopsis sp.]
MRVLIAGASGLIGTPLVTALREAGHNVRRLVRREARAAGEYSWDPPAGRIDEHALDGVDTVINLCGYPVGMRWSAARKQMISDSRVEPTEVLAEAVAERGVPSLINASGINFYGDTGETVVDESCPRGQGFLAGLCENWEGATATASRAGARVVLLRTGIVLGPGGLLKPLKPLFRIGLGGRLGGGKQYMPWISLRDEVAAILFLVEHETLSGPVNLCVPDPVTNAEFTRTLARALHRPAPWWVPADALRIVLGEAADELALVSIRAVPQVLEKAGFAFADTDIDRALTAAL